MAEVFVGTYLVRIYEDGTKSPSLLGLKGGSSAHGSVLKYLQGLQTCHNDAGAHCLLHVTKLHSDATDVWGWLERGEYGLAADIVSQKTLKRSYKKSRDDAEMLPFYFRFHLPSGAPDGILVLQRSGVHGAYTSLRLLLEQSFRQDFPQHRFHMARRVQAAVLEEILRGAIKSYRVVTHSLPSDIATYLKLKGAEEHAGTFEIVAKAKRDSSLWAGEKPAWFKRLVSGEAKAADVFPAAVKSVKASIAYGSRTRMVDLSDPDEVMPYSEITDQVTIGPGGHPDFDSIDSACIQIRDALLADLKPKTKEAKK